MESLPVSDVTVCVQGTIGVLTGDRSSLYGGGWT